MSYLNFDKTLLVNLERSLSKELLLTNRAGAYCASTLVGCNTRKYHGQLVVPVGEHNYVLLSSLDETIIQHGAAFNLGLHEYEENQFSPNGHKYIREFDCITISKTTYRVGGVVLTKEHMLVSFEPRILIRYTLLDSGSATTMRFKPFLAFRDINELTHANGTANTNMDEIPNGRVCGLYGSLPQLYMQFNKQVLYVHDPHWYSGIRYRKEKERGFEYKEDQMVPGYFEVQMRKGESIIFSAGISELKPAGLKQLWEKEAERRMAKNDMYSWLKNSASQFYKREGDKCYLLPGYPWYKANARSEFFAVCACTMGINRPEYWDVIMNKTAVPEVRAFLGGEREGIKLADMDEPDSLLWFVYAIQEYTHYVDIKDVAEQYGDLVQDIIAFYRQQKHPRAMLHHNGLLWVDGTQRPATWMCAVEDGRPITPRTGYVVEINAYWYNAMCFATELLKAAGKEHKAELMEYQSELTRDAFVRTFWNGLYLNDYVVDNYQNKEVRPNQIWAVSLPYSPLDKRQQKAIVDICTKELYTPKGLRTLSPKSGNYRPLYRGGQLERDRNFHNGPVWPSTLSAYGKAYLRVYQHSGESFMRRLLVGFEAEMSELCVGTLNEIYDGNPPYKGHGGMSYAPSVAAALSVYNELRELEEQSATEENNEQK